MKRIRLDYRHILCVAITLFFLIIAIFLFPYAFPRLVESMGNFGRSASYYFTNLFSSSSIETYVSSNESKVITDSVIKLPVEWEAFIDSWHAYWVLFITKSNVAAYFVFLFDLFFYLCQFVLLFIPLFIAIKVLLRRALKQENNKYNQDTKPLKIFKKVIAPLVYIKNWLFSFYEFVKERKIYWIIWAVIWSYSFNFFSIVFSFLGFYFTFVSSFDLIQLYNFIRQLFIDLSVIMRFIPVFVWIIIALVVVDKICCRIAYKRLNRFEFRNRGFINARPVVSLTCGTMGKKKTTATTDMGLSCAVMFRDKAFELILENDLKFPNFPWINLEVEIKAQIESHNIYNLATCKRFVSRRYSIFKNNQCKENLFDYDYEKYGYTYNDNLKSVDGWTVIETYVQLYFIYTVQSSLLISNYSVREDSLFFDLGNFPVWDSDFFKRDSRLIDSYSRHSKILDFDMLRLGKKLLENNPNADGFEFGVILITEVGKERGNTLELQEKKKNDDSANQKNDLFNSWLKMVRHSATVDNYPFVKVITDEQRPESWGADARDLSEITQIVDSGEKKLVKPLFFFFEFIHNRLYDRFVGAYTDYRFYRGDNTLLMYLFKGLVSRLHNYYVRTYNLFGYCVLKGALESGRQDGPVSVIKYYLMNKKIYSRRFSTDCFSDFFKEKALSSNVGIADLDEYETEKATFDELGKQNSYFMKDLLSGLKDKK